jgi:ankyrin repeat protein
VWMHGHRALNVATQRGHVGCVRLLLAAGASVAFVPTPLHSACNPFTRGRGGATVRAGGDVACVDALLRAGADPLATDRRRRRTPMHLAARNGRPTALC